MDRGSFSPEELTEFVNLMQVYEGAMYEISTKLEILDSEFQVRFSHDPIHHMERRLKSVNSILGKLKRKTLPVTVSSIKDNLFDVAGIRVICNYRDDVYSVSNYLSARGVSATRITTVSYGKERPIAMGSDEGSWAQNRRAVTVVIQ